MMRSLKLLLWFCFGLILGGAATYASAETIPATQTTATKRFFSDVGAGQFFVSSATAYNEVCSKFFNGQGIVQGGSMTSNADGSSFVCGYWSNGTWVSGGQTQGISSAWFCGDTVSAQGATCGYTCPSGQNWTVSGANCTRPDCSAGQMRDPATGQCIIDCGSSAAKANVGKFYSGAGAAPSSLCIDGCGYSIGVCGIVSGAGGSSYTCKAAGLTGGNCSGAGVTQASAAESACAAQGQKTGVINGITVCAGPFDGTKTSGTTTSSTTGSGAGNSNVTSETTCADGKCTTTTTTTTTSGGQTTSSTTTTEQGKGDFCAANPRNPQCIGAEQDEICSKYPDRLECKMLGAAPASDPVQAQNKGLANITQYTTAAGSCPADVALPHGAAWDFGPVCDLAQSVRPIVIALGWLFAGLMIFGYFRS